MTAVVYALAGIVGLIVGAVGVSGMLGVGLAWRCPALLPLAHPAAPSHVAALMSGVMIKLGVYGLVRVSLDWLGEGPAWWGAAILLAGAVSAVVGVLSAIVDRALAPYVEDRWPDAAAMKEALTAWRHARGAGGDRKSVV